MKYLYVTPSFFPADSAVAIRSYNNVKELLMKGHEVVVITGSESSKVSDLKGCKIINLPVSGALRKRSFIKRFLGEILYALLSSVKILLCRKVDRVIITSPPFFALLIMSTFLNLRRKCYIVDVRDRYPQVLFSLGVVERDSFIGKSLMLLERYVYRKSLLVITVTQGLAQKIKDACGVDRVEVVMNGFDEDVFHLSHGYFSCKKVRFVLHGNFGRFFDHETFVKIARYLNENAERNSYEICLMGDGYKIDHIKNEHVDNVIIYEHSGKNEVSELLASSHVGISIHSNNESMRYAFPVKIFEYAGTGLPSIVIPESEAGQEVEKNNMGRTFSNENWLDAANFLLDITQDRGKLTKMRESVENERLKYSRKEQASKFCSLVS